MRLAFFILSSYDISHAFYSWDIKIEDWFNQSGIFRSFLIICGAIYFDSWSWNNLDFLLIFLDLFNLKVRNFFFFNFCDGIIKILKNFLFFDMRINNILFLILSVILFFIVLDMKFILFLGFAFFFCVIRDDSNRDLGTWNHLTYFNLELF